jgi:hypothetical protein
MSDPNVFETEWEPGTPPGLRRAATGATLAMTEPGGGKIFPGGSDQPVMDALVAAMELDAAEDQRGLSTS